MKVVCIKIPEALDGGGPHPDAGVTVGSEYEVMSLITGIRGGAIYRIVTDTEHELAVYDSKNFEMTDGTIRDGWSVRIDEDGVAHLGPASWLATGFWEAYYDGEPAAVDAVESELQAFR